ncbi:hypothetical protein ACIOD2_46580 [Amycolatopsis sp. NPDC088138]|uniref:hypothetical protein n=1 Tax=Amycolatopsis sp. NPDC088138 TaxID=3363938 RepID=UPI003828D8B9
MSIDTQAETPAGLRELAERLLDRDDVAVDAAALQTTLHETEDADLAEVLTEELLRGRRALLAALVAALRHDAGGAEGTYDVGSFLDAAEWMAGALERAA